MFSCSRCCMHQRANIHQVSVKMEMWNYCAHGMNVAIRCFKCVRFALFVCFSLFSDFILFSLSFSDFFYLFLSFSFFFILFHSSSIFFALLAPFHLFSALFGYFSSLSQHAWYFALFRLFMHFMLMASRCCCVSKTMKNQNDVRENLDCWYFNIQQLQHTH